jgi:hypothetical protein
VTAEVEVRRRPIEARPVSTDRVDQDLEHLAARWVRPAFVLRVPHADQAAGEVDRVDRSDRHRGETDVDAARPDREPLADPDQRAHAVQEAERWSDVSSCDEELRVGEVLSEPDRVKPTADAR